MQWYGTLMMDRNKCTATSQQQSTSKVGGSSYSLDSLMNQLYTKTASWSHIINLLLWLGNISSQLLYCPSLWLGQYCYPPHYYCPPIIQFYHKLASIILVVTVFDLMCTHGPIVLLHLKFLYTVWSFKSNESHLHPFWVSLLHNHSHRTEEVADIH